MVLEIQRKFEEFYRDTQGRDGLCSLGTVCRILVNLNNELVFLVHAACFTENLGSLKFCSVFSVYRILTNRLLSVSLFMQMNPTCVSW